MNRQDLSFSISACFRMFLNCNTYFVAQKILIKCIFMCLFWIESYSDFCHNKSLLFVFIFVSLVLTILYACEEKMEIIKVQILSNTWKKNCDFMSKIPSWCHKAHGSFLRLLHIFLSFLNFLLPVKFKLLSVRLKK